jgi:prepilin-type N-terminal cleavage/methylation domain-containing protein
MKTTIRKSGFTLIELLIVIGLIAALAAVLLPSLMGDRDAALRNIDKYNQAGTLRTLRQYEAMTGNLPNGLHTGLMTDAAAATTMQGVSSTFTTNFAKGSVVALTDTDIAALENIGITELAYGVGKPDGHDLDEALGYSELSTTTNVISLPILDETKLWKDKNGNALSFNGKGAHYLGHEGYTKIIPLFITPTAQWEAEGKNWVKGFSVGMDIPATTPLPESEHFPYYIAYVGIQAGYEVKVVKTGTAPDIHVHGWAINEAGAVSMLEDEMEEDGFTTGTFNPTTITFTDGVASTVYTATDTTTTTYTFTLEFHEGEAKLLGTSSPDCIVTNP